MGDEAVFHHLLVNHLNSGMLEARAYSVDPFLDAWVEAHLVCQGAKVWVLRGEAGDQIRNECFSLFGVPSVNVLDCILYGFVAKGFSEGASLKGIRQHSIRDHEGWGREVDRFYTSNTESAEGYDMVLIMIVLCSFAEVLKPGSDFEDTCDHIAFIAVKVSEQFR